MAVIKKKGQVFLAGAILFLVMFVAIGATLSFTSTQESSFSSKKLDNIAKEYEYTAMLKTPGYLHELSSYMTEDINGFQALYIYSKPVSGNYQITIGNFLGTKTRIMIGSREILLNNTETISLDTSNTELQLSYTRNSEINNEIISLSGTTTYLDLILENKDFIRKKFVYVS